ncbi:MAG TPA: dihydrodipicolinate synthase family protein [Terriglobia bacterium]|jgi:4-hydroxy-tetrahydrodipicolinate synthase|nr:dihydrodipicolinate synthase family protein [Terriglobia bacterium]
MVSWLRGVIPAVITPFDGQGRIDQAALREEIDYHLSCGVTALCAGGSTGEGAGLRRDEVKELNSIFVEHVKGRVPVIAGVIPDTTDEAVELGLAAKEAGVAALQVTPPHYLFQPGIPELVSYYSEIHTKTQLGVILYNVLPWGQVTPDGVAKLLEAEAIIAVKQSGSNMHQLADMVYRFGKQVPVLSAVDDLLYPSFVIGAHGTLSAIASILPRQCVELYEAVQSGDHTKARALHNQLLVIWRAVNDPNCFYGLIKGAIELQGRRAGLPRRPHRAANAEERARLGRAFEEAGIPLAARAKV